MTPKPKPPKIPRCLCGSWIHWLLQIASPSKFYTALLRPTVESEKYFMAKREYDKAVILCKIDRRTCTREEWHRLRRMNYWDRRKNNG